MAIDYTRIFQNPWGIVPQNAVKGSSILSVSGVAIEGETVTIGGTEVYEFNAGGGITAGNIDVDISADTTASQGTLTIDTQITTTNTMTIGSTVYTFLTDGTESVAGDVSIGTDLATCQANLVAAVNGDALNDPHPLVTIADFATNDAVITAISGGTAGDAIATTETFTAVTNIFDGVTLGTTTAGVDAIAADAITALALSMTTNSALVSGTDGALDTLDVAALLVGTAGNSITCTETMANGAFDTATLEDGQFATPSGMPAYFFNGSTVYFCDEGVSKWDETGWKSGSLSTL